MSEKVNVSRDTGQPQPMEQKAYRFANFCRSAAFYLEDARMLASAFEALGDYICRLKQIDEIEPGQLRRCPFCGGEAHQHEIEQNENPSGAGLPFGNEGGAYIECDECQATTRLHFDFKENLVSDWNSRVSPSALVD